MTPRIFFKKVGLKLASYADRIAVAAGRFPKRYLAGPVISLIGPIMLRWSKPDDHKSRDKPHILILRNKFYSKNSSQISTEELHLDNTLKASKLATFEVLTYDHDFMVSPLNDLQLIAKCRDKRPDAIILSSWWLAPRHPSIEALRFIRDRLGIRLGVIWWDSCSDIFWKSVQPFKEHFDVHVIIDNPNLHYIDRDDPFFQRILHLWAPQDESLYFPRAERDIAVSFLGQVSAYRSYRSEVINHLVELKVPGHFSTNDRHAQGTHGTYAEMMGRSKISLNFSYSVTCNQLKSRVFEVLFSGALLLESENEQTSKLFTPMKDYVPFSSKEDLVDKIRYYLDNEHELIAIAEQGRATAMKQYNATRFWELFLNRLELTKPE
jgi:hypothetical protein